MSTTVSPLLDVDLKNLRFYASRFREHKWETPWVHWSVFEQTLNEIAARTEELERRFQEECAMRDTLRAALRRLAEAHKIANGPCMTADDACPCPQCEAGRIGE